MCLAMEAGTCRVSQVPVETEALLLSRTTSLPFIPSGAEARSHGFDGISGIPASHCSQFSIIPYAMVVLSMHVLQVMFISVGCKGVAATALVDLLLSSQ